MYPTNMDPVKVKNALDKIDNDLPHEMAALTESQRAFIYHMIETGAQKPYLSYMHAYPGGTVQSAKSAVYRLMHREDIVVAMRAVAARRVASGALLAVSVFEEIAMDAGHKDRLKAAKELAGLNNFIVETRNVVTHEDHRTVGQIMDNINRLAKETGLDPRVFLKGNIIDAEEPTGTEGIEDLLA